MSLGQWSKLEAFLTSKKNKGLKGVKPLVNANNDLEKIRKYVKDVEKNTRLLKSLLVDSLPKVWENFNLPVRLLYYNYL